MPVYDLFLVFFLCSLAYGIYDLITHQVENSWKVRLRVTEDEFNMFDMLMDIGLIVTSLVGIISLGLQ